MHNFFSFKGIGLLVVCLLRFCANVNGRERGGARSALFIARILCRIGAMPGEDAENSQKVVENLWESCGI
jgi:hypothetical protein